MKNFTLFTLITALWACGNKPDVKGPVDTPVEDTIPPVEKNPPPADRTAQVNISPDGVLPVFLKQLPGFK